MSAARRPFAQPSAPTSREGARTRPASTASPRQDAIHAAEHALFVSDLGDASPARQLRLGFDSSGHLLDVVALRFDSGNELVIHAMKARRHYLDLLD